MPEPGRNDPCPCGSGRKYKKCCLPKADVARAAVRPRDTPRDRVMPQLMRFAYSHQFDGDHLIADTMFWADYLDDLDDDEAAELVESEDAQVKYNAWFIWDLFIEDNETVADAFLQQKGRTLDPDERAYVERMRRSYLSLYQVEAVERGRGVTLRDLLARETVFVHEVLGSEQIVQSDLVGARVVPDERGLAVFEGGLYLYDVADKGDLLADLKRSRRRYLRRVPAADRVEFLKRHGMIFHYWWLDRVVLRPPPRITTTDGDEMMFTRSVFDIADPAALIAALGSRPDVERDDEDGVYTWGEDGGRMRRILATLRLDANRLSVETMSRNRDARCREWLVMIAGVTFRASALESPAAVLERARRNPSAPAALPELAPEIKAQIEREMMDAHYRRWLDEPVPALRDTTPREAAASRTLRPLLIDLLREFDNHYARAIRRGVQAYDTSWLWDELRLR